MDQSNKTNLIVNYLPQTLTDEEFRSMFLSIGPLNTCKVVRDRHTNYSYGFGFVEYQSEADAERAIDTLNGMKLQHKTLKVAYSRTGEDVKNANLYISSLPRTITSEELKEHFSEFGQIINARVLTDGSGAANKGIGFVLFDKKDQADVAQKTMDGQCLPGYTEKISVKYADGERSKAAPPGMKHAPPRGRGGFPPMRGGLGGRGGFGGRGGLGGGYGSGPMGGFGMGPYSGGFEDPYEYDGFGAGYGMGGFGPGPMRGPGGPAARGRFSPMHAGRGMGRGGMGRGFGAGYGGGDAGTPPGAPTVGHILFVYNILPDADERFLWQLFSPFGAVINVDIIWDNQKGNGLNKGFGFVTMRDYADAEAAIRNLSGYTGHGGKPLQVSFKADKSGGK